MKIIKFKFFTESKSFTELSNQIKDYSYILEDEGYKYNISQYGPYEVSSKLVLIILPRTQSELQKFKYDSESITNLLRSQKSPNGEMYLSQLRKKYPWLNISLHGRNFYWPEFLYQHLKEQDFFEEWVDRIREICESNGCEFYMNFRFSDFQNDGLVFFIEKKQ